MNYEVFDELIQDSRVRASLENVGYETIVIASGYAPTEFDDAGVYLKSQASFINEFERVLLLQTPLSLIPAFSKFLSYEAHRDRVLFAFEGVAQLAHQSGAKPKFVFAHILSPHPPFVFGPGGEKINPAYGYYVGDAEDFPGIREEYLDGYPKQLHYLNQLLMDTIEEIQANSSIPPVIILQGDHGPGAFSDFHSAERSCLYERAAIFNAYFIPQANEGQLYDSITPVNSFRILFDAYLGTDLDLLEDRSYFGEMPYLFDLMDITDAIDESSCHAP